MKRRLLALSMIGVMMMSAAACGNKTENTVSSNEVVSQDDADSAETEITDEDTATSTIEAATDDTFSELDEYSIDYINETSEEVAPSIDLTDCDTFTQIIDKRLTDGMGYANEIILDEDVFLVCSGTFTNPDVGENAIDATVFKYTDGQVEEIGKVISGGTAYPITIANGYLFTGSNHWICKYAIANGKLSIMEKVAIVYDENGKETYYYESDDGGDYSDFDPAEAEKIYDSLIEEMMSGTPVNFSVVVK